ncbi:MAG: homoserine O-succinyltransferase [Rhodospirillales bacterium]|nr:homoserine O-succinyltransferase [Rhodospirillales bacterium]MCB9996275.1 homoserine O-succinyltransferase [Rhodospirillales bacterium]
MPIKIPENLPGRATLEQERVPLIFEERALRQDIRPLQIALLNLMPDKIQTETQIIRALGGTPLQIEMTLLHTASHTSKHTPADHLSAFYKTPEDVADQRFDGMIMTGAPVGHLPFEEVTYWDELQQVMAWAEDHVYSCFFICWGALAAVHHYYDIPKTILPQKRFGIFPHKVRDPFEPLTAGFDNMFNVPVSRHTEVDAALVRAHEALDILVESDGSGLCLVQDEAARRVFMFNHLEYDRETLKREYDRDAAAGMNPQMPCNYYPDDDPAQPPVMSWRAHRNLMFHNWINMIYQGTPFNLDALPGTPPGWDQVPNKRD